MKVKGLSLISTGCVAGSTPYATSDRGWPSRLSRASWGKSIPWDPLLHGTHGHAMLSLPRVSLFSGNIANFSDACSKDRVTFSDPVMAFLSVRERRRAHFVFSQEWWLLLHLYCCEVWFLKVLCKQGPAFYHYQQTPYFPERIEQDPISGWFPVAGQLNFSLLLNALDHLSADRDVSSGTWITHGYLNVET